MCKVKETVDREEMMKKFGDCILMNWKEGVPGCGGLSELFCLSEGKCNFYKNRRDSDV